MRLAVWLAIGFVIHLLYSRLGRHLMREWTQQGHSGSDAPLNGRED